jgi:hypothetical protein
MVISFELNELQENISFLISLAAYTISNSLSTNALQQFYSVCTIQNQGYFL